MATHYLSFPAELKLVSHQTATAAGAPSHAAKPGAERCALAPSYYTHNEWVCCWLSALCAFGVKPASLF